LVVEDAGEAGGVELFCFAGISYVAVAFGRRGFLVLR
jgi:hypothetical protein